MAMERECRAWTASHPAKIQHRDSRKEMDAGAAAATNSAADAADAADADEC